MMAAAVGLTAAAAA
uniref:Uncharacterized protein n=1 Tax=Arundo donax TaxID=35708 RepID=A0A0A9AC74_ARUDO